MVRRHRRKIVVAGLLGVGIAATFLRELVFAWTYGDSPRIEAFRVAFAIPLMLGQSLAPAVVGAALPALAFAAAHGQDAYRAMKRRVLLAGAGLSLLMGIGGFFAASAIVRLTAPGFEGEQFADTVHAFRIFCVYMMTMGLCFGPRVILNLHDVLWPGATVSLVISAGLVTGALGFGTLNGLAWSGTVAAAALLALHLLARRTLTTDTPIVTEAEGEERPALLIPVVGVLLYQVLSGLPRFLDRGLASTMADGTIAALDYSYSIMTAPSIFLGTTFVMVAFPPFARAVAKQRAQIAARRAVLPFAGLVVCGLVGGVALHFLAGFCVDLLLGYGAFDSSAGETTTHLLSWHALGMPFGIMSMVLAQGLMAMRKVGWLVAVGGLRVAVRWFALGAMAENSSLSGLGQAMVLTEVVTLLALGALFLAALRSQPQAAE